MDTRSIRILVVEDDVTFSHVLQEILQEYSPVAFDLTLTDTLSGSLSKLGSQVFDVILLDLNLPDSADLQTFIRIHARAPGVAIVVLTGTDDDTVALSAVREGAQDYLVKDQVVDGRMLWRVIRYAIERKRSEETLREREEFFRLISENVNDLISVTDRDGRRLYNSPSYEQVLGDPARLRGTNAFLEIHPDDVGRLKSIFQQTVTTGVGQRTEFRFVRGDGTVRYIESEGSVIKDARGEVGKVVVVSRDITERKEAEEALRLSEQRYKRLLGSTTDYIYTVTLDNGRPASTTHGQGCVAVTGYAPEEYAANPDLWYTMVHEEDRSAVLEQAARAQRGEVVPPLEHRIIHKDGSVRWVRNTPVPRHDPKGHLIAYDGLISNITARRSVEERLRQSEALYHSLVESLPQNIFRKDTEGRFTFVNHRFSESLARPPSEILGRTDFDFFPKEFAEKYRADDRRVMESGLFLEIVEQNRSAQGEVLFVHVVKIPIYDVTGHIAGIQGIFWDITEQKRAEEELRRSKKLLEAIVDNSTAVIYLKDREFRYVFINARFEQLFHVDRKIIAGRTDYDIFPREIADGFRANDRQVVESRTALKLDESAPHDDGPHAYISLKFPLIDSDGNPYALCGISTDITDRKRAEERQAVQYGVARALAESATLDEASPRILKAVCDVVGWDMGAVWSVDHQVRMLRCVHTCHRPQLKARTLEARTASAELAPGQDLPGIVWLSGKTEWIADLAKGPDSPRIAMALKAGLHSAFGFPIRVGKQILGVIEFFARQAHQPDDEMLHTFNVIGSQIGQFTERKLAEERLQKAYGDLARSQNELLKVNEDLKQSHEDLVATQMQLIQAEKLESIGTLATGIAHEVKNPLQIILMGIRYLDHALPSADENVRMTLAEVRAAVERANRIIGHLMEYTRLSRLTLREDDLNSVVHVSLSFVKFELANAHISLTQELDPQLPTLPMDKHKIEQVFVNLFINAVHAMPAGGTLSVRTYSRQIAASERMPGVGQTSHWRVGERVTIAEITDTGTGIPEEKLGKIFDPFFTTKPPGKGTGLGLWVVRNIIELHGGSIHVSNRPEGGVRVTITLKTERKTEP